MDQTHNPYAPSRATLRAAGDVRPSLGVMRDGKVLVVPRDNDLPERCVKCNAPAHAPIRQRTVYWHHPAVYIAFFINIILYIILALAMRKTAKLSPGLCERHKRKRTLGLWVGWGGFFVMTIVVLPLLGALMDIGGMVIGILLILATVITGIVMSRIVYANHIDDRYVRLKGCGEPFLDTFPSYRDL
jgi:hypothetical protein